MTSKAEKTKQFIIEKTAPVFNAKGYAGTSLNDMIAVTGLTKGSIYGNFDNKDAVALAAFEYNFRLVMVYIKNEMDKHPSYIDKLLVYPHTYRKYNKLPFLKNGCPVANTSTEADDTHAALKEKASAAISYWRGAVERQLKAGINSGEIKASTDVTQFSAVLTALVQGAVLHAKASGKMPYLNAAMDYLEKIITDLKT